MCMRVKLNVVYIKGCDGHMSLFAIAIVNAILPLSSMSGMDIKLTTPATTKPKQLVPLLPRYFQLHNKIQSILAGIYNINTFNSTVKNMQCFDLKKRKHFLEYQYSK